MSKGLLFALLLLFATFLSAYAEEASEVQPKRFSLGVGPAYGFLLNGGDLRASHAPGVSLTLGYELDARSSLFLNYTRQRFNYGDDGRITYQMATLGYKTWLTEEGRWRPWLQAGAGYSWRHSEWTDPAGVWSYEYTTSDFQLSAGGGVRYELGKDLALNASAVLFKDGAPWRWRYQTKLLSTSIGLEYRF